MMMGLVFWANASMFSYTVQDYLTNDGVTHSGWALQHQRVIKTITHRHTASQSHLENSSAEESPLR